MIRLNIYSALIFLLFSFSNKVKSQTSVTYNWNTYPAGGTTYTHTPATGCSMTVNVSGTNFNNTDIPKYTGTGTLPGSNNGQNGLFLDQNWTNTSSSTTVNISFSSGVINPCFTIYDINRNNPCGISCASAWNDRVTVAATGGTVTATSSAPAEHSITGNGTASVTVEGNLVCNATNGTVQFCFSGTITAISITYTSGPISRTSGSGSCGGDPSGCINNRVNCTDPARQYITISSISGTSCCGTGSSSPPSSISGGTGPFCPGTSTTLTANGGNANTQWFTGSCGGTSIGTGTSITVAPTVTTTYYAANVRCDGTLTSCAQITVNVANVNPSWNSPSPVCSDNGVINLASLVTGTPGGTFSGTGVSGNNFNPTGLNGTYPITYTVTSGSCTRSESHNITVIQAPSASWTPPGTLCNDASPINLNSLVTGTTGGTWSGTGVTGNSFNPSGLNGNYNITYTVGTSPCVKTSTQSITVVPSVNASWNTFSVCSESGPVNLNTYLTGTPGGTWSGTGVSGNTFNPTGLSGNVSLTYSVGTPPCNASLTQNVTVTGSPSAAWNQPPVLCSNSPVLDLSSLITGTSGGTWSGTGVTGSNFNPTGLNGSYNVTYTVGTPPCVQTSTQAITVNALPSAAWSPTTICSNSLPIDLNSLISGTPGGVWSGSGVSGSLFNPQGFSDSVFITYQVGSGTCASSQSHYIKIIPSGNPAWTSPSPVCAADGLVNLSAFITGTPGGTFTGTGVSGNNFDPTGLNGNIAITYSVGQGSCAASQTHVVQVSPVGNPAWDVFTMCSNDSPKDLNAQVTGFTGGSWSGAGVTDNWFNPNGQSGNFSITYTVGNGSCASSLTQNITVIASPNPSWNPDTVCFYSNSVNLNNLITGSTGGTFSGPSVNNNLFNPFNQNGLVSITYTVNNSGCIESETQNMYVVRPEINAGSDQTICEGQSINLSAVSNGGSVSWSGPNGYSFAGNNLSLNGVALNQQGAYIAQTNLMGCFWSDTVLVNVNPLPVFQIQNSSPACTLQSVTLSATQIANATYQWSGPRNSNNNNLFISSLTAADTGTYNLTVTLNGCSATQNTQVSITPQITPIIQPIAALCQNDDNVILQASPNGGVWIGTGIVNQQSFSPALAGVGNHIIKYFITGTCSDTAFQTITVKPQPDLTLSAPTLICEGDNITLSASNQNFNTYSWTYNGIGVSNSANVNINSISVNQSGEYVLVYSQNGCFNRDSITITVNPKTVSNITPAGPFCSDMGAVQLTAVDSGGIWSGTGVNPTTGVFNTLQAQIGNNVITYTSPGVCNQTSSITILVIQRANAQIIPHEPFCLNDLPDNILSVQTGGTWSGNGIINSTTGLFNPAAAGVGNHIITYSISNVCGNTDTVVIRVNPMLNSGFTVPSSLCEYDDPVQLNPIVSGGYWSGNGIVNNIQGIFDPQIAGAGNHVITYTLSQKCGTNTKDTIKVYSKPSINILANPPIGCAPLEVSLINLSGSTTGSTCYWTVNGNVVSNACGSAQYVFNNPGCYDIGYSVTSAQGCVNSEFLAQQLCVEAKPKADFDYNPKELSLFNSNVNFSNLSVNSTNYFWDFASYSTSTDKNPEYQFQVNEEGKYVVCLEASNAIGCTDSVCKELNINGEFILFIPNAFTPNADGKNETFKPVIKGYDVDNYVWSIFDRWGLEIFTSNYANIGWDGKYQEKEAPQDVYVWRLRTRNIYSNKKVELTGTFTLVR